MHPTLLRVSLSACLVLAGCASTVRQGPPPAPLTSADQMAIKTAIERGERLYRHDRWAWIASDLLMRGELTGNVATWLVRENADGGATVLWIDHQDPPRVLAEVVLPAAVDLHACASAGSSGEACQGVVLKPTERALDADEFVQHQALRLLRETEARHCGDAAPNTALFREGGHWVGYLLSATQDANKLILSGHTRVSIDASAQQRLTVEPMFRSCLVSERDPDPAVLMATSLMTPVVDEGHVFTALNYAKPFVVMGTARHALMIAPDGGRVQVSDMKEKDSSASPTR